MSSKICRVAVLASGRGSNLQALIDASEAGKLGPAKIALVFTNKSKAPALERARKHYIETVFLSAKKFATREEYDQAVVDTLNKKNIDLVCLAGFMRILSPVFVKAFWGKCINIHPALLPSFPGLHAQEQAFDYGVRFSGATVHFVDEGVDTGPIILQAVVPVLQDDTADALAERILREEHKIYPEAVRLFAEGSLKISGRKVLIDY